MADGYGDLYLHRHRTRLTLLPRRYGRLSGGAGGRFICIFLYFIIDYLLNLAHTLY